MAIEKMPATASRAAGVGQDHSKADWAVTRTARLLDHKCAARYLALSHVVVVALSAVINLAK